LHADNLLRRRQSEDDALLRGEHERLTLTLALALALALALTR